MSGEIERCESSGAYVYLICSVSDGEQATKIGLSDDPHRRAKAMQTASPNLLRVSRVFGPYPRTKASKIETACHRVCGDVRMHGEWFLINPNAAALEVDFVSKLDLEHPDFDSWIDQMAFQFGERVRSGRAS